MKVKVLIAALQAMPDHLHECEVVREDHSDFGTSYEPVQTLELSGDWLVVK